jgi:hypothetical protein
MFSLLHPTSLTMTTPPELGPWGWTTIDLWCAPLITGIYALLTHAQPFWADAHGWLISQIPGGSATELKPATVEAVDAEVARAACTVLLCVFFSSRALYNYLPPLLQKSPVSSHKRIPSSSSSTSNVTVQKRRVTPSRAGKRYSRNLLQPPR